MTSFLCRYLSLTHAVAAVCFSLCASAAYGKVTCDNAEVVDTLQYQFICQGPSEGFCNSGGVFTYRDFQKLTDEQITNATETLNQVKHLRSLITNEASAVYIRGLISLMIKDNMSARHLYKAIGAIPTDYNSDLDRYRCRADVTFDREALHDLAMLVGVTSILKQSELALVLAAGLDKNDVRVWPMILGMAQPSISQIDACNPMHLEYTVQSKRSFFPYLGREEFTLVLSPTTPDSCGE